MLIQAERRLTQLNTRLVSVSWHLKELHDHPYYGAAIRKVTFGSLTGRTWGFGVEGDGEDWYFFPLAEKNTLVVVRRYTSRQVGMKFGQWPSETMLSKILSSYKDIR